MGWAAILKTIGSAVGPLLSALVPTIVDAVAEAEEKFGEGVGPAKKGYALEVIKRNGRLIAELIERLVGRDLVDDKKFADGLSDLVDGVVGIINSIKPEAWDKVKEVGK